MELRVGWGVELQALCEEQCFSIDTEDWARIESSAEPRYGHGIQRDRLLCSNSTRRRDATPRSNNVAPLPGGI